MVAENVNFTGQYRFSFKNPFTPAVYNLFTFSATGQYRFSIYIKSSVIFTRFLKSWYWNEHDGGSIQRVC